MTSGSAEIDLAEAMGLKARDISEAQRRRYEGYAEEIFAGLGMDTDSPGTRGSPRRFIQAMIDSTSGYDGDPKLLAAFRTECRGDSECGLSQVVEGPIPFFSLCEHHALPFYGEAYIGYIADEQILGISKLTRLVRLFSRRFAVQERMGNQIGDALETMIAPLGVAVYLKARHLCMEMRGVRESASRTRTTVWRGRYAEDDSLRKDFLLSCGIRK